MLGELGLYLCVFKLGLISTTIGLRKLSKLPFYFAKLLQTDAQALAVEPSGAYDHGQGNQRYGDRQP